MNKLLIPFKDYKRIFCTIYSILKNEDVEINHSCIYFSVIGSFILQEHYKLDPKVYMGIAAYMVDDKNKNVLTFAEKKENELFSSESGFHSWIVVNDWVIDFTAPLFPSMLKAMHGNDTCEPKMFQKPLNLMCSSAADLDSNGDFFIYENIPFANEMMEYYARRPFNTDIAKICCKWYRRPPLKMFQSITIGNMVGELKQVQLKSCRISGSW